MREYIIPQEFNQSDRIGKFTIPQAMIMGAGGILIMFLLSTISFLIAVPLSVPIAIFTLYIMIKKVNGIPIYEFAFVYLTYRAMPKLLMYRADNIRDEFLDEEIIDIYEE